MPGTPDHDETLKEILRILMKRYAEDAKSFSEEPLALGEFGVASEHLFHVFSLPDLCLNPSVDSAMRLFWSIYEWWKSEDGALPPILSDSIEEYTALVLRVLDTLYELHRVPYEPDADSANSDDALLIYLHVAAARAFRTRKRNRSKLSEESVTCFEEVIRTYHRIVSTTEPEMDKLPAYVSMRAILGMSQWEISRLRYGENSYEESFYALSQSTSFYEAALDDLPVVIRAEHWWGPTGEKLLKGLDLSLKEAGRIFQGLKDRRYEVSEWKEVARTCTDLYYMRADAIANYDEVIADPQTGYEHPGITWYEFWYGAREYALNQVSPNNLMRLREEEESRSAEDRLKKYFFPSSWTFIPVRAHMALVNADKMFNSREPGRFDGILNELRIALEEVCHKFIWQPWVSSGSLTLDHFLLDLQRTRDSVRPRPSLWVYERACGSDDYREFLYEQRLDENDIRFLTQDLPTKISQLRSERNIAEHERAGQRSQEDVRSFYRGIVGVGQVGVLPELMRIAHEVKRRKSS